MAFLLDVLDVGLQHAVNRRSSNCVEATAASAL